MRCLLLLALTTLSGAQACPWLNGATAEGILGGPVQLKVNPTTCEFVRAQDRARYQLRIEVRPITSHNNFESYLSHCGRHRTQLKGIGNEAFACQDDRGVLGRVRDQMFIVRISVPDHAMALDVLEENARKIAEQVAGALF
ncbi:MAG: hypothetical protein WAM39_31070 [Bryobacteraceae bacterium]